MKSSMMQNPSDPEATFRNKAGKEHPGDMLPILEESVGANGSVITEYQYGQNNHSDSQLVYPGASWADGQTGKRTIMSYGWSIQRNRKHTTCS